MGKIGDLSEGPAEITFEWKIKDFFSLSEEIDILYESPTFYFYGASWEIWLYPNGKRENDSEGWIGIYLMRNSVGFPLYLNYSLNLKTNEGKTHPGIKQTQVFDKKGEGFGISKLISRKSLEEKKSMLIHLDTLTVICTLKCDESTNIVGSYISELQKLSDDLKQIYVDAKKTDFLFKTNDGKLHAHRLMLETRSPVFAAMLRHDTKENQTGEVSVIDTDKVSLEAILLYIYSGDTKILTPDNVFRIYAAAEKYDVKHVKEICSQFIIRNLSIESVCDVIKFSETYQDTEMSKRAREYFKENADKILETDNWENFVKENHNISIELLATIVKTLFKK